MLRLRGFSGARSAWVRAWLQRRRLAMDVLPESGIYLGPF
jgi:hypothetical protein